MRLQTIIPKGTKKRITGKMYSKVDLFRKVQFALTNTPFSSLEVKLYRLSRSSCFNK